MDVVFDDDAIGGDWESTVEKLINRKKKESKKKSKQKYVSSLFSFILDIERLLRRKKDFNRWKKIWKITTN